MPGLMAIREEFVKTQPLKGARITGSLHMTIQTAVLIETLKALGADVRWASCNIFSPRTTPPRPLPPAGTPGVRHQGRDPGGLLGLHPPHLRLRPQGHEGEGPNMILDDGGDATLLMHLGRRPKRTIVLANPAAKEERILFAAIKAKLAARTHLVQPQERPDHRRDRRNHHRRAPPEGNVGQGHLLFRAINVNDSVTKSKFDNLYGCRESLVDGIKRATDVMMAGKVAVVAGYGDVGRARPRRCALSAQVWVTEIDPSAPCRPRWKATRS